MLVDVYDQGLKNYCCIDAFLPVSDYKAWLTCPICKLKPLVWKFDNGKQTGCGCGSSPYDHFSVKAESVCSALKNNRIDKYDYDQLRTNWNHWCETGEFLWTPEKDENGIYISW